MNGAVAHGEVVVTPIIQPNYTELDRVASLVADPPLGNSTTLLINTPSEMVAI